MFFCSVHYTKNGCVQIYLKSFSNTLKNEDLSKEVLYSTGAHGCQTLDKLGNMLFLDKREVVGHNCHFTNSTEVR